jgi:molybdopterin-containing oxidoreductase family iron-sulfur binding subunit
MADHHLPLKSSRIETLARAVAAAVGVAVASPGDTHGLPENWVAAVAKDLQANAGKSLVLAGIGQPPVVHALAHAINDQLGNVGATVTYTEPLTALSPTQTQTLAELVADMQAGLVKVLIILEANPVYSAPVDEPFTEALQMVPYRVRVGLYEDETSALCHWHVPAKHFLESWGDARAYDGTVTLIQPLIEPLYPAAHNAVEIMAVILGQVDVSNYDLIRGHWEQNPPIGSGTFDDFWKQALYNGFIPDSALPPKRVSATPASLIADSTALAPAEGLELVFRPDPSVWDGSFANNGWLQELPKPLTKLTWDNAVLISPATADSLGVVSGDVVNINYNGRAIFGPVWVMPGQADDSVTLFLGYGRTRAGRVGNGVGVNTYKLRTAAAPWFTGGVTLRKSGDTYPLASTQMHWNMEGRHIVKGGTLAEYQADPHFVEHIGHHEVDPNLSLMPGWEYNSYKWGMVIDLNACNGCNACVTACQAENNVPVVGKEHVLNGREMHWLRLDTYYEGGLDNPQPLHQPMMCQHCEQAPCELVCPVSATVHDAEGLNVMVYNRCIGTRYCSNNCPYKVRRFNYLQYSDQTTESLKAVNNPNVTVRVRGVMEKCTYCIQRISQARIQAKNQNRRIGDGEVVTACQSACPTKAIVFGDLNDDASAVAKLSKDSRGYHVLSELGVRPRTTYLAKLTNPNPELANEAAAAGEQSH